MIILVIITVECVHCYSKDYFKKNKETREISIPLSIMFNIRISVIRSFLG